MRKNNFGEMTVVEEIISLREEICATICKHMETCVREYKDEAIARIMLQKHCRNCPVVKLHYGKAE